MMDAVEGGDVQTDCETSISALDEDIDDLP